MNLIFTNIIAQNGYIDQYIRFVYYFSPMYNVSKWVVIRIPHPPSLDAHRDNIGLMEKIEFKFVLFSTGQTLLTLYIGEK